MSGKYTSCINYDFSDPFDATLYSLARHIDANGHQTMAWTNALGNEIGTGAYANVYPDDSVAEKISEISYNALNKPTAVTVVDEHPPTGGQSSVTTTMTYDDMGRLLTLTDPDQGTFSYSYDADSHVIATTQTSGSNSRTVGVNYDLLGRVGCEQTAGPALDATGACSAGNPLVVNTYDTTVLGTTGSSDFPVGQLTQSVATTYYPDGSQATATEQFQHDQRGRASSAQMQLGLPSAWSITNALPTFQLTQGYNDANQPTTTSTQDGSEGYTFTNVYDPTNGALQELSNNGNATANLVTLAYNEYAQLSGLTLLNGASSSPAQIASEQFSYDANLRPTSLTATWLPPSGNSGQILAQSRAYDNASNVTSANTTFAAVPGQSGSGGADVQNFCYDEQNRLVWSGNGGTQPSAGTGTCGTGTLASGLSGAGYTAPFSYTNLGQIWQGPVNGQGTAQQYLYCNSQPHQLSGIYPSGTTCSNTGSATASYSASYDPYGNETTRVYNGTTDTLSYDTLNHLVEWSAGSNNEWNVYDASGNRVLLRSISGGVTRLKVYAFGLQELDFGYNGYVAGQIDYYSLAGHLIGSTDGTSITYDLTDAQGSVLASLSASAVQGEQIYGPYGNQRYTEGTIGTDKGYTGQFHDALTGLDYYNARFYDPVAGVFLSPDSKQGNPQGMDPYAYVGNNPETNVDPTGNRFICPDGCGSGGGGGDSGGGGPVCNSTTCSDGSGHTVSNPTRHWHPVPTGGGGGGGHGHMGAGSPLNPAALTTKSSNNTGCNDACQRDKKLIDSHLKDELAKKEAGVAALALMLTLPIDLYNIATEFSVLPLLVLNVAALLIHFGNLVMDIAINSGKAVNPVLNWVMNTANTVINGLEALKGIAEFFSVGGLAKGLLKPLLDAMGRFVEQQSTAILPGLMQTLGGASNATLQLVESEQEQAVDGYTATRAYNECVQDHEPGC